MECPRCHAENRPDARFCGHCGEALTPPDGTVGAGLATCPSADARSSRGRSSAAIVAPPCRQSFLEGYGISHHPS